MIPSSLLGHMTLRRETRGLSVKIYFFILAHLVALLSEVNILFNLFTSGKLRRRRLALATLRANFNVARTSAVCLAHRPVLKLKICPTTREVTFNLLLLPLLLVVRADRSAWQRYNLVWL